MRSAMAGIRRDMSLLSKERQSDQQRLQQLEEENKLLQSQIEAFNNAPTGAQGTEPHPAGDQYGQYGYPPGAGAPVSGQTGWTAMPPMAPPGSLDSTTFTYPEKHHLKLPWIPSGSFARALVIEGADANASVTGAQNTAPMQFRLTGKVTMPNDRHYDLSGCFVSAEAYGDVSSERAEVRTRSLSCHLGNDIIDQKIAGHVSFRGKNGIKGEVVMRNGKILGWAFGAGFVDGIGKGMQSSAQPVVGLGATAAMSGAEIAKSGLGGGTSQAAKTLSDYYIKRAEQYHPIIPIGAGNEVTVVFQDGFQLQTTEEVRLAKENRRHPAAEEKLSSLHVLQQMGQLKLGDRVYPAGAGSTEEGRADGN
jgi:conjugal transfer pilus assembly protein TraB